MSDGWMNERTLARRIKRHTHTVLIADEPLGGETRWAIEETFNFGSGGDAFRAARALRRELPETRVAVIAKDGRGRVQWTDID